MRCRSELNDALSPALAVAVAERYGVWVQKSRYGRTYMGIARSTFVIDAYGIVIAAMAKVQPATHADDVLAVLA